MSAANAHRDVHPPARVHLSPRVHPLLLTPTTLHPNADPHAGPTLILTRALTLTPTLIPLPNPNRVSTVLPTTGWAPKSGEELQAAIEECLQLSHTDQGFLKINTDCSKGPHGPIGSWDVSAVTDMGLLFDEADDPVPGADNFNGDLSKWDVSR